MFAFPYKRVDRLVPVYAAFFCIALCCSRSNNSGGGDGGVVITGGSEVWGTLVDPDGNPLDSVLVRPVPRAMDKPGEDNAIDTIYTDADGKYAFGDLGLPPTTFNLYGTYRDSQYIVYIPDVFYEEGVRNDVGFDTMYAPGIIQGYALTQETDHSGITCYIPGTSFAAWTDSTGFFAFIAPPGTHTLYCQKYNYLREGKTVTVVSGQTTVPDTIILEYDTTYLPVPRGLSALYDTAAGTATVWWNSVNVADLEGYNLYLDSGSAYKINSSVIIDTFYTHRIFSGYTDTATYTLKIQVAAEDSFNNISDLSRPVDVVAVSPAKARTWFTFTVIDTPVIMDTVRIVAGYGNQGRRNTQLTWAVAHPDSIVRNVQVYSSDGFDTLACLWPDSGTRMVYIHAVDEAGDTWCDSIAVAIDLRAVDEWKIEPSPGESRRFLSCAVVDSVLYAVGGCYDLVALQMKNVAINSVEAFDPRSDQWRPAPSLVHARWDHGTAVVDGKLYVAGGRTYNELLNTIEVYDPSRDSFIVVDTLPAARSGCAVVALDGKLYLSGGLIFSQGALAISSSIDKYDPVTGAFSHVGDMLIPRTGHQAVGLAGDVYFIGGIGGNANLRSPQTVPQRSMEIFDPKSTLCTRSTAMSIERYNFAAAAVRGRIYAIGGNVSQTMNKLTGTVEEFDPASGEWNEKNPMSMPRQGMGIGVINNRIYVVGGTENGIGESLGQSDLMEMYIP
ncbi:MAG: hypothetical protein GF350_13890 [Chitinivibrionales bacterium]|nr:hypothetical protein [Chitinivibrionales bacterium]